MEIAVHLAVAGDVFDGVFLCCLFPGDVLGEIWDWIESVSEGFPTYILRPPKRLSSTSCTYFRQQLSTVLLESAEGETKICVRIGYRTQDLWLLSQTRCRLRYLARLANRVDSDQTPRYFYLLIIKILNSVIPILVHFLELHLICT